MKLNPKQLFLTVTAGFSLAACSNLSTEVENKLIELKTKTESLDSLINKEVDKVLILDSIINTESEKVKKIDSLIHEKASQIDSFSNKKIRLYKKITK